MPDFNQNVKAVYTALQRKNITNLGTEEEFAKRMHDSASRKAVYDKMSTLGFSNLGTFDDFEARFSENGQQNMGPVQTDAPMQAGTPQSRERTGMAPTALQTPQGGQPQKVAAASTSTQQTFAPDQKWAVPQASEFVSQLQEMRPAEPKEPEVNPFPYRGEDEKDIDAIRKRINDLQGILADVRGDTDFADEYDNKKREVDERTRGAGFVRGDVRGKDIGGDIVEGRKWLDENKTRYGNAVEDRKAAKDIEDEIDQLKGQLQDYLTVYAKRDLEKAQDANREQMPGGAAYEYGVSLSPVGALASSVIDNENFLRAKAGEIYRMAGQELNQGSKYDPGYKGSDLEKALTAINQYAEGAANQLDTGSLTQGLSEGSSLIIARRIGDKYNKVITDALKGMKMSNGDMNALISFIDSNGRKLQGLVEELDKEGADLKTMNDTYEDMVRRGDPNARKYGMELQKRLDAYNKRVNEEYNPLRAQFDSDMAAYQKINDAIDAAIKDGMSDGDMAVLDALEKLINAKTLRATDVSTASKAGAGAEQSAEFMIDFILTGGISEAGNKVATKIATNRMLKKVGAEAIKDMAIKPGLGLRFATDMVTSGIRTAVMAPRNLQAYGEQLTEYVGKDSTGRYNFDRTHLNAFLNTALTQYIEYWSEGFGSYFSEGERALFRAVTGKAPTTALGATLGGYRGSIGRYLEHAKFDGMFNEMLEEVVGAGLNGLSGWLSNDRVGDEEAWKQFWAGDNLATLTLSFLPMSIISAGSNVNSYLNMRDRYKAGEQMLNDFVKSGKIDQADVDYLREHASEMTPEQIKKRIMDISDKARPKNGGHLPGDFAKNIIGFVEGCFAADMRNEAWDESREKMAVVGAFTTAYNVGDAALAWDAAQEEQAAKTKAMNLGFTEDELDRDAMLLAREAAAIRETERDRSQALSEYAVAKAQAEGLKRGYLGKGEKLDEKFENDVRQNLDNNGIVITATTQVDGEQSQVFVDLTEGATIGEGGKITTPSGPDGLVLVRTSPTAQPKQVKASSISGAEVQLTDQYIDQQLEDNRWMRNARYEVQKNSISPRGMSRMLAQRKGTNVVVKGYGAYMPVRVERMTDEGRKVAIKGDKDSIKAIASFARLQGAGTNRLEIEVEKLFPLLEREADGSLSTYEDEETKNTTEQEQRQAPQIDPNELPGTERTILIEGTPTKVTVDNVGGDGVWFHYTDAEGNERNSDMSMESFMDSLVEEQAPVAESQEVQEQAPVQEQWTFPVDQETGRKVYDHPDVTPQMAFRELYSGIQPGSMDEVNRRKYVSAKADNAVRDVAAAQNKLAGLQARRDAVSRWELGDNEELDDFEKRRNDELQKLDAEIAEISGQLPELLRKADHWDSVLWMSEQMARYGEQERRAEEPKRTPKRSRRARIARARQWEKRTGIGVEIIENEEDIKDKAVIAAKKNGEKVGGWYDKDTGKVYIYLPDNANDSQIDKTYIHEVVSHKGLEQLLGTDNYNALLDRVWNNLMTPEQQQQYLDYNDHLSGTEEYLHRAAADEFIARLSERLDLGDNRNLFQKFVDWVKEIFDNWFNEDLATAEGISEDAVQSVQRLGDNISKSDLFDLLRDSLARFEAERRESRKKTGEAKPLSMESLPQDIQDGLKEKGLVMDGGVVIDQLQEQLKQETGYKTPNERDMEADPIVGDIRMSHTTVDPWARNYITNKYGAYSEELEKNDPVVNAVREFDERCAVNELVYGIVPQGTYKYGEKSSGGFAGPLRSNIEYVVTFDMDTSCPRSLQYLEYIKQIEKEIKRPMTQREMIQLTEMMRVYGQMIPCVYCYCENKRQALKQYYTDFMKARQAVITAKTDDEALKKMYGHRTSKAARNSKDPAVALNEAAYKVFLEWRNGKQRYNPSMEQLWNSYRNERNVILTLLDDMLDTGKVSTSMTDEAIKNQLCKDLGITQNEVKGAIRDIVSEWKWNRIEDRPHEDFQRVEDEDMLFPGEKEAQFRDDVLSLWREMTSYGKSASQAKNVMRYIPYTDELKTLSQEQKDFINGMGGLRMHSSNDFRIDYVLDYFQFMADMAENGMFGHTYTKSPEFVRIFGNSGYKINMSIAAYEDSHGVRQNKDEGFDWDEAKKLRSLFPNAGVMLMATSDAQIQLALDSDWIDMFIPFHASGLPKEVWYDMRMWQDYSSKQNERFLNSKEMKEELVKDGVSIPKGAKANDIQKLFNEHFNIQIETYTDSDGTVKRVRPHFLPGETKSNGVTIPGHNNDYQTYIDLCRKWGVRPRFYGIKVKDNTPEGGGRIVDISEHPAYMKCIKETARTDTPQTAIQFNFDQPSEALSASLDRPFDGMTPMDYAMSELESRAMSEMKEVGSPVRSIYESYKKDTFGIVPKFINGVIKHGEEVKKRTGKDLPLDFLTPEARRWFMEDRGAIEAAYKDVDTIPYHPHAYDADGNLIMAPEEKTTEPVVPVIKNGRVDSNTMMRKSGDIAAEYPNWMDDQTSTETEGSQRGQNTQVAGTIGTYRKVADWIEKNIGKGAKILDASSGLGLGTLELQQRGFDIEDIEPYPGKGRKQQPTYGGENAYQQAVEDGKQYDYIISNAVLNVIPDDWRADVLHNMARLLKPGGQMFINTRKAGEEKTIKNKIELDSPQEVLVGTPDRINSYQRFFTPNELKEYVENELGDGYSVEIAKKGNSGTSGLAAVVVTKNADNDGSTDTRFRKANQTQNGFISNAEASLNRIKMEKATPEQWVKMLEKEGGLKAGEDKWLGLSDWLKSQDKKTVTKQEIADYIAENRIQIDEVKYSEDVDVYQSALNNIRDTVGRGKELGELQSEVDELVSSEEYKGLPDDEAKDNWLIDQMVERYGDDFREAYFIDEEQKIDYNIEPWDIDQSEINKTLAERKINSTRLGYTTEGLDNKREIAMIVPTIDPWNTDDNIHFGDAGEGRAVAWARFGETTDENGNRVLVIDEIQSKRHQEGREKGYTDKNAVKKAKEDLRSAAKAFFDNEKALMKKYGIEEKGEPDNIVQHKLENAGATEEEISHFRELYDNWGKVAGDLRKLEDSKSVPSAPFEKNWHELAMKRMLRLAAEEGYDYVAWTTGEQQAERYNIGGVVDRIVSGVDSRGKRHLVLYPKDRAFIAIEHDGNGNIVNVQGDNGAFSGAKNISDIVGKELAEQALQVTEPGSSKEFSGDGLKYGGEGMKGFYDDILPRFMNKYGKKWGIKVSDITLPNVEEAGRTMHAVPVTPEMKESVMQGQTMFRKVTPEQDAEYMDAVNSGDMEKAQQMVRDAFKAAFPNTKAVDENGEPLVVYHGTQHSDKQEDFYVFNLDKRMNGRNFGEGYYFTDSKDLGSKWARRFTARGFAGTDEYETLTPRIIPAFLNIENPIDVSTAGLKTYRELEFNIRQASQEAHNEGKEIDGKIIRGIKDGYDIASDIYLAYNPSQIKSADPVTYDDNGNVIPLSERFNQKNNDIRFRKVTPEENQEYMDAVKSFDYDKAGQILRDAFKEAYPDTKIVDENGEPLKVFHGSRASVYFTEFDYNAPTEKAYASGEKPAYFFTGETGANRYARDGLNKGRVIPAYLAVNNPYEIDYEGAKFTGEGLIAEAYDRKQRKWVPLPNNADGKNLKYFATPQEVAREFARVYPNVSYARLWDDFSYTRVHDAKPNIKDLMDSIDRDQYDGAIVKNIYEVNATIDDYVAFRPEQIKSADTVTRDDNGNVIPLDQRFNQEVKDIRFRRAMTEDEVREERIAEGERELTDKTLDSMPQSLGSGVMRVFSDEMPKGHESDKGYFNPETNTVSVCMDNVLDGRDAVATAIHETVGHKGLDGIFGEQYKDAMVGAYASLDADGRAWVNGYIVRNNLPMGDDSILRGMMEYMAGVAERNESNTLDAVNDVLSQAVDMTYGTEGFRFTNRELSYILRSSFEHMRNADWLNTREGRAKDILMKRELGINESDQNRQVDPEAQDAGIRFRRGYVGNAVADYERENKRWQNVAIMEIQNADLPVKNAYEAVLKEKFGDRWEEKFKSLPENEDYLMRHNLSSSRADTENFEFMTFRMNPMLAKVEEVQRKLAGKKANTQKLRDAYDSVLNYLYAVSGLERNEWKRNNGGEARDYSGITALMGYAKEDAKDKWQQAEDEAKAMIAEFEKEINDKNLLDELWDSIRACTDFSLDHAYKYGLLTKEEYERLHGTDTQPRMWNYYLPLRGFSEETAEEAFDYVGYTTLDSFNNGVVKEANGRWSLADSPLANIQNIAQREIVQGNENWSRQALLRFVRNTGKNSLLSERDVWYVRDADTGEWTKAVPEGEDIDKFEKDMLEKQKNGNAKKDKTGLDIDRIMANKSHENQHLIRVKTGGVEHAIWVNGDPAMAKAVTGIGKQASYQNWRAANRVFSNMFTTYSLDFTAKNLIRDTLYSRMAMLAKEDREYRWTFEKNWWSNGGITGVRMMRLAALWDSGELVRKEQEGRLSRKEQLFVDFMRDGGQTGYTVIRSVEKLKKDIEEQLVPSLLSKTKKKVVDGTTVHMAGVDVPILGLYTWGVRTLNEAFELLTRFTAYETSREVGRSGQRAAYDAKEISVNFNRRGAQSDNGVWGSIAAYFGGTHYFFNAGVQGFDNFLRLFKTSPKTMTAESVAVMSLGFITPWINSLLGGGGDGDDENKKRMDENWYWNLPEWVRRNNIILRLKNDFYIAVPLPVEFRALYGLGDIARSIYDNKYPNPSPGDVTMDIMSTVSNILPVNPIEGYNGKSVDFVESVFRSAFPDIGMFAVDWVTNKDYTGRELVKKNIFAPEVPTSQGAYASTPKALVDACQWMGEHFGVDIAPGLLRDGLSNYLGGRYKFAEDLAKQLYSDDERPSRWDDIPFLSGFTGHLDEDRKITYVNSVLYEYKDVMENVVKKMNLYNRSKDIKAKQAFTEEETLPDKAKIQKLLLGKDYNIAKMYYNGMADELTGEKERVVKVHKTGKRAGKKYTTTQEIKIPGVNTLRKAWQDYRDVWAKLPNKTEEEKAAKADAYKDMVNAWHEYYNAAADLADQLMKYEYEGTITE